LLDVGRWFELSLASSAAVQLERSTEVIRACLSALTSSDAEPVQDEKQSLRKRIDWAECELSRFRRGYLLVRLDFSRHLLIWKESNRWVNDFVRAVPEDKMLALKEGLLSLISENKREEGELSPENYRPVWHVSLGSEGEKEPFCELCGEEEDDPFWKTFTRELERVGRRSFEF